MSAPDETMAEIVAAVELGRGGAPAEARQRLTDLWERVGPDGDPLHRVTIAHFLADLQDDVRAELRWDERALAAAGDLTDERAQEYDTALRVRGMLPSLHLNLADCLRRLGDAPGARQHLARAEASVDELADDGYGRLVRTGLWHVQEALEAGSTEPLPSAP
ncbi:hypothetical protein SAMN05660209_00435 [Geodermatophilus africanus]|uniref:Tetratricopeptide repeat-containing protein n=1 Tax=Geodermatophilus africanus TaxID=1137993 RepID=A0A1H3BHL0_9ACTN|nr:hypothetical protein [Geodermatophilus africanus]SDX41208.1 hypothetical protein SAMN05660209_00435 [Geodermatophilus africanus]